MPSQIEDYALLGDTQTAALVGRDGSIDWLCLPRFDSPACFAALLGSDGNGRWQIAPQGDMRSTRRTYRGDTVVLETYFDTPEGSIFYHDTSGCWTGVVRDLRPNLAIVAMAGRGNIDGEPLQGSLAQFVGRMGDLLRPKQMILGHHDAWMPPMTRDMSSGESLEPVREQLRQLAPRTELEHLSEPLRELARQASERPILPKE